MLAINITLGGALGTIQASQFLTVNDTKLNQDVRCSFYGGRGVRPCMRGLTVWFAVRG